MTINTMNTASPICPHCGTWNRDEHGDPLFDVECVKCGCWFEVHVTIIRHYRSEPLELQPRT
jgi:hypothetical protein